MGLQKKEETPKQNITLLPTIDHMHFIARAHSWPQMRCSAHAVPHCVRMPYSQQCNKCLTRVRSRAQVDVAPRPAWRPNPRAPNRQCSSEGDRRILCTTLDNEGAYRNNKHQKRLWNPLSYINMEHVEAAGQKELQDIEAAERDIPAGLQRPCSALEQQRWRKGNAVGPIQ